MKKKKKSKIRQCISKYSPRARSKGGSQQILIEVDGSRIWSVMAGDDIGQDQEKKTGHLQEDHGHVFEVFWRHAGRDD